MDWLLVCTIFTGGVFVGMIFGAWLERPKRD